MNKLTKTEIGILLGLSLWFWFTAINVNQTLGLIFVVGAALSVIFILADPSRSIPLKKSNSSTLGSIVWGAGAYAVLLLIGNYLIIPGISAIRALLSSTTPTLASNATLNTITFGIGVPLTETIFFFVVIFDVLASLFNVKINREGLTRAGLWILIIVISLAFMFFHLQAKGITNFEVLTIVFFMAIISLVLIVWKGDYESALYFHIIANLAAVI